MTNGFYHPYHLDESTFIFSGALGYFFILFHFSMKTIYSSAASHPRLFCLPMSHKKDARVTDEA